MTGSAVTFMSTLDVHVASCKEVGGCRGNGSGSRRKLGQRISWLGLFTRQNPKNHENYRMLEILTFCKCEYYHVFLHI